MQLCTFQPRGKEVEKVQDMARCLVELDISTSIMRSYSKDSILLAYTLGLIEQVDKHDERRGSRCYRSLASTVPAKICSCPPNVYDLPD